MRLRDYYADDVKRIQKDLHILRFKIYIDYVNRRLQTGRAYFEPPKRIKIRGYTHYIQVDKSIAENGLIYEGARTETRKIIMHELRHLWQHKHKRYINEENYFELVKRKKIEYNDIPSEKDCIRYEGKYNELFKESK